MHPDTRIEVFAPAKINLALHVTGQRADGYHLIDSLVTFADVGDRLILRDPASGPSGCSGPFSAQLPADQGDNLVHRICQTFWPDADVAVDLCKNLPVASGIGGGSADAAACYRVMRWLMSADRAQAGVNAPGADLERLLALGADIPMCVTSVPSRVSGIGEDITPLPALPVVWAVLANPGISVSTPEIFKALSQKINPGLPSLPEALSASALIDWLAEQRNDLEPPACKLFPQITDVLSRLSGAQGCRLARMSGSGATCFGLFIDEADALAAAQGLAAEAPAWWVRATALNATLETAPQEIRSTT